MTTSGIHTARGGVVLGVNSGSLSSRVRLSGYLNACAGQKQKGIRQRGGLASRGYSRGFQREPELQWSPWKAETFRMGWGKGRESPGPGLQKRRKVGHPHLLLWLYFLSLSPGCSQVLGSLMTPGESGPRGQQAPSCLGVFTFLLYTYCGTRRSKAIEGCSSNCLGLTFMPL